MLNQDIEKMVNEATTKGYYSADDKTLFCQGLLKLNGYEPMGHDDASEAADLDRAVDVLEREFKRSPWQPIEVGMPATMSFWSDVEAGTVVKVSKNGKTVWVQEDAAKLLNGPKSGEPDAIVFTPGGFAAHCSGRQRYEFSRDTEGVIRKYTLRKNGRFMQSGHPLRSRHTMTLGHRYKHYDYNF